MIVFVFSVFQCLGHDSCVFCGSSVWIMILFVFSVFHCLGHDSICVFCVPVSGS